MNGQKWLRIQYDLCRRLLLATSVSTALLLSTSSLFSQDDANDAERRGESVAVTTLGNPRPFMHSTYVTNVAYAANADRLACLSLDGKFSVWDYGGQKLIATNEHGLTNPAISISPDGRLVVVGVTVGDTLKIWDLEEDNLVSTLGVDRKEGSQDFRRGPRPEFSPDGDLLAIGAVQGNEIHVLDCRSFETISRFGKTDDGYAQLLFDSSGKFLFSRNSSRKIQKWNVRSGELDRDFGVGDAMALVDGGRSMAVVAGKNVRVLSCQNGTSLRTWSIPEGHLTDFVSDSDSGMSAEIIRFSADSQEIFIRDTDSGELICEVPDVPAHVQSAVFAGDGNHLLVTASGTHCPLVYDIELGQWLNQEIASHSSTFQSLAYSENGKTLVSASADSVRFWDLGRKQQSKVHRFPNTQLVAASPNAKRLAISAFGSPQMSIIDADSGDVVQQFDASRLARTTSFFRSFNEALPLTPASSFQIEQFRFGEDDTISAIGFIPKERLLVWKWNGESGETLTRFSRKIAPYIMPGPNRQSPALPRAAFSRDQSKLALATYGMVSVIEVVTGDDLHKLTFDEKTHPWSMAFSPNGKQLAMTDGVKLIRVWDLQSAAIEKDLPGNPMRICFSNNGKYLLACSEFSQQLGGHGLVQIWDTSDWNLLFERRSQETGYFAATFSLDDRQIVVGLSNGTIELWDWNP